MGPCSATDQTISKNKIMDNCIILIHNAPINEMPHLPPPGAGGGFANRGELNHHPWGPKFWLIPHYFVYYLDIIT